jgi:hypothetical protein
MTAPFPAALVERCGDALATGMAETGWYALDCNKAALAKKPAR